MNRLFKSGGAASMLVGAGLCLALLGNGIAREVPLGNVQGTVTMSENGRPLPGATVIFRPQFEQEGMPKARVFTVRKDGHFSLPNLPAGEYIVEAYSRAHSLEESRVYVPEGKVTPLELALEPSKPYVDLSVSQHVFTPSEQPEFLLSGFVPDAKAAVRIYKASPQNVIKSGSMYGVFNSVSRWNEKANENLKTFGKPIRDLEHEVKNRDGEGVFSDYVKLDNLPIGLYWLECQIGGQRNGTYLNVTRLSMVTKHVGGDVLTYVTNISTGKPEPGVQVGFGADGALQAAGKTAADGTLRLKVAGNQEREQLIVGEKSGDHAFVGFYRYEASEGGAHKIYAYTERPVYRPGDEVNFKGIVRRKVGNGYAMPAGGRVTVRIMDYSETLIERIELPVSEFGSFNGRFTLNREIRPGDYQMLCRLGDSEFRGTLRISAYRKPEFTVRVKPEKKFFVRGERGQATVECEYFFGGPVVGAQVSAYITRSPYWWGDDEFLSDYEDYGGGEYVAEVEAVTDGSGKAVIRFDTQKGNDPRAGETDYIYTINATVSEGDKYFDGSGSVRVTRGEYALSVEPSHYVSNPGQPISVEIMTKRHDNDQPVAGQQVSVEVGSEDWDGNTSRFVRRSTHTVRTDAEGKANLDLTPEEGGSLVIRARAEDNRGNQIQSQNYVWVDSASASIEGRAPEMAVTLDKKGYRVGDTMKVLIKTGNAGGSALVTVEGDRVYDNRVVPLTGGATVVEMPVQRAYAPNAFVTVAYTKDKKFMEASERLEIAFEERKLDIRITSDKPSYQPGETAVFTVHTSKDGRPVPAEVSLGVVDESIYSIAEERTDIIEGFYPMRSNAVQTSYSFPELYLDGGDKTPADVQVRSRFLDTAHWQPSVVTGPDGRATITVHLPDNLTSWRATAVGVTERTEVGQATHNVRARKDLMVRLHQPAFMVQGDEQRLTATVVNDTGREAEVSVDLQAAGAQINGDLRQTIRVAPGQPATVEWTLVANRTGTAVLTAKAWINGGASDGVRVEVPVAPYARLHQTSQSGVVQGVGSFTMAVRPGADRNTGRLSISLTPSIASAILQSADGLIDYPYGCAEQTTSRFLAAVMTIQTAKAAGAPLPEKARQVPRIVREGYERLRNMQVSGGVWGWFGNDEFDPWMTAYVLEGIHHAVRAGYSTNIDLERSLNTVEEGLRSDAGKKWQVADRLYLGYALALHGRADAARELLSGTKTIAKADELAIAAMLQHQIGDTDGALATLSRLVSSTSESAMGATWDSDEWYGQETTGRALQALTLVSPDHPLIPKVVRHLMQTRRSEYWVSTRDSAIVMMGLSRHLAHVKENVSSREVIVLLNGQQVRQLTLGPEQVYSPDLRLEIPMAQLRPNADNVVEIRSSSRTPLYYAADLRQYVVQERLGQVVGGDVTLSRSYYSLEPRRLEDGTQRLMKSSEAIEEIESGQPVRVVLTIDSKADQEFILIEDPIPSNTRIMDRGAPGEYEEWTWWYSEQAFYDDRAVFFSRRLPAGRTRIEYTIRAEAPGRVRALPTVLTNMYDPSVRGTTADAALEVNPR